MSGSQEPVVVDNVARVRERIHRAARRAGRNPSDVTLVAVTKTVEVSRIAEALAAGVTDLGENRVQEAWGKFPAIEGKARLHLIGHLQTNKAARAVSMFDVVHSVDSTRLVVALDRRAAAAGRTLEVFVEVNTTAEEAKHGVAPDALPEILDALGGAERLVPRGLMTLGPLGGGAGGARRAFRALAALSPRVRSAFPAATGLSMGMSGDFEAAVEEGSTLVRVGSAIFGAPPGSGGGGPA